MVHRIVWPDLESFFSNWTKEIAVTYQGPLGEHSSTALKYFSQHVEACDPKRNPAELWIASFHVLTEILQCRGRVFTQWSLVGYSTTFSPKRNPAEYLLDVVGAGSRSNVTADWAQIWSESSETSMPWKSVHPMVPGRLLDHL
jgi:ATP-binding cassette subfamily G (WHITE) protein 2 (SNQ2)